MPLPRSWHLMIMFRPGDDFAKLSPNAEIKLYSLNHPRQNPDHMTNLFRSRVAVLALIFALLPASAAHAWIEAGHKIIGILVWDQLTPEAQAKATAILKQHPRYKEDLLENLPDGLTPEETDKYAFATAATWPDIVRAQGNRCTRFTTTRIGTSSTSPT